MLDSVKWRGVGEVGKGKLAILNQQNSQNGTQNSFGIS